MKFYQFECHDYMDLHPTIQVNVFENEEKAKEFASHMNRSYSGGTTRYVKEMTAQEAAEFLANEFKAALLDRKWPDEDAKEEALRVASEKNVDFFLECYGRHK